MTGHWHYQVMRYETDRGQWYGIHEYYPLPDGDAGWTEETIGLDAETVDELRDMLWLILRDIDEYGVKDYG